MNKTIHDNWSNSDPLNEIRAIREAYAQKFNYNVDAIFADVLRREKTEALAIDEGNREDVSPLAQKIYPVETKEKIKEK